MIIAYIGGISPIFKLQLHQNLTFHFILTVCRSLIIYPARIYWMFYVIMSHKGGLHESQSFNYEEDCSDIR